MQVETVSRERVLIVRVQESRFDSSLAMEFQSLIEKWADEGYVRIILDLREVDFIDSTILGVIVQWFKRVSREPGETSESEGGNLVICNIGFKIESLLKLTRMDRIFSVYANDSEAFQAMSGNRP